MFNALIASAAIVGLNCPVTTWDNAPCTHKGGECENTRGIQLVIDLEKRSGELYQNTDVFYSNDVKVTPNAIAFPLNGYGSPSWVIVNRNNLAFEMNRAGGVCEIKQVSNNRQF